MRENRKKRDEARQRIEELNAGGKGDFRKIQLLKQQSYKCLYLGEQLSDSDLEALEIDHVVPRRGRYSGSDSMYNVVVTKAATNRKKADRTPYEYLKDSGKWDAYCERVKHNATSLGKKKTRLLTAEHPEELDEKYMSLAETAWIARTARDIVCLKFGWQPGAKGEKQRIIVIPGPLTAKARRRYKLNSILAPDESDPDTIDKKNRDDKRHHALDAMVVSFLRAHDTEFPEGVDKDYFAEMIDTVVPENIAFEKPELEETIYARRIVQRDGKTSVKAVKRIPLTEIAENPRKANSIVDHAIRSKILDFLDTEPDKETIREFFENLNIAKKEGGRVLKVAVEVGEIDEYLDMSKNDGRGQYRRGAKHQGQFLYLDEQGKAKVRPVYVYESRHAVKQELLEQGFRIIDFFSAGCLVETTNDLDLGNRIIPAGRYILASMWTDGRAKLNSQLLELRNPIHIKYLLDAGFKRIR